MNKTTYFLNKSKTKWVNIGLGREVNFHPVVQIGGAAETYTFNENEWFEFLENQGILANYFFTPDAISNTWQPVQTNSVTIYFKKVNWTKVIHLVRQQEDNSPGIFLGSESLFELIDLVRLIEARINVLKSQDFNTFYEEALKKAIRRSGNFIVAIYDLLRLETSSENSCALLELLQWYPEIVKEYESTMAKSN